MFRKGDATDNVPAVFMALPEPHTMSQSHGDKYLDGLLQGSSDVPIGFFAFALGRHSLYVLYNPLDELLRPKLKMQRDARCSRFGVIDHAQNFAHNITRAPAHELALRVTSGRAAVDFQTWFNRAEDYAEAMPHICKRGEPTLGKSKWHHVYYLLPSIDHMREKCMAAGLA